MESESEQLSETLEALSELIEGAPEDEAALDDMVSAVRNETQAAVEPFRAEIEELGSRLTQTLEREEELGHTLAILADEVQRLRRRMPVRAPSAPALDDEQVRSIAQAVIAALPERESWAPAAAGEPVEEIEEVVEAEPEEPRPSRRRPIRAAREQPRPVLKAERASKGRTRKRA